MSRITSIQKIYKLSLSQKQKDTTEAVKLLKRMKGKPKLSKTNKDMLTESFRSLRLKLLTKGILFARKTLKALPKKEILFRHIQWFSMKEGMDYDQVLSTISDFSSAIHFQPSPDHLVRSRRFSSHSRCIIRLSSGGWRHHHCPTRYL